MPNTISRVFVVDDDPFFRGLVEYAVRRFGCADVQTFEDGTACIEALTDEPNVIFLDQMMGSVSGTDALQAIKRFNPGIYVVLVSGQEQVAVAVDALKFGAFDYVVKDEHLAERLTTVLHKIGATQALLARRRAVPPPRLLPLFSLLPNLLLLLGIKFFHNR